MAMTQKDRQQVYVLIILLAVGAAAGFWFYVRAPLVAEGQSLASERDSLRTLIDSARADLREGTVEQLRQRVDVYERSLGLMRRLVPTGNEVANLIDEVSIRAQLRGVRQTDITPLTAEIQVPYEVYRYRFSVVGTYDQIGEFMADIASLERIMVPYDVGLNPVAHEECPSISETNACLQATFVLRSFVKPEGELLSGGAG